MVLQRPATHGGAQWKLSEFNNLDFMPNWVEPLMGTPEERAYKLRDPGRRAEMKLDVEMWPDGRTEWHRTRVLQVAHERNYKYEGLTVKEIAEMMSKHPVDAFLDLALDEDLETEFEVPPRNAEAELERQERELKDPHTHISVSDGGAHIRFGTISQWPVFWLSYWIRDREIMTLEEGHYKMSALPAWLANFNDRGVLRPGAWGDIIVYNQEELGYVYDRPVYANDFPGGERRLIQKPKGLRYIIVNGTVTFEENNCTRGPTR